jgi:hypothetical protein
MLGREPGSGANSMLDAFAILGVLRDEPAADEVLELVDDGAGIPLLNAAEVGPTETVRCRPARPGTCGACR